VFAILPVDVLFGEAEVGFVDEGGGLEGVVAALATHVGGGDAVEFGVDEGEQLLGGVWISAVDGPQKLGNVASVVRHGVGSTLLQFDA
jgi:hypothetical protein